MVKWRRTHYEVRYINYDENLVEKLGNFISIFYEDPFNKKGLYEIWKTIIKGNFRPFKNIDVKELEEAYHHLKKELISKGVSEEEMYGFDAFKKLVKGCWKERFYEWLLNYLGKPDYRKKINISKEQRLRHYLQQLYTLTLSKAI